VKSRENWRKLGKNKSPTTLGTSGSYFSICAVPDDYRYLPLWG
jgi:hypothetical protein